MSWIPNGGTASYEAIATRLGVPTAFRAVARANATNRIYLLVPCHRVLAKDGTLSGYGGGVWRKRLLLELEGTASSSFTAANKPRRTGDGPVSHSPLASADPG